VWDDCSKRYDNSGYAIPSLITWARADNLEGFKKILRDKINVMLDKGDIKTDFDVACILKEIYKYDYKCSSIQKNVWWQFINNRWSMIECAHTLSIKMSTDIALEFAKLHSDIMTLAVQETGQHADILQRKCKDIQTLIFNLKKGPFKERIIKECSCLFYEKDFESKLDQNNYLVGFTNGVYDLRNRIFRNGSPDDLIGKTVGYAYKEFSREDNIIKDIEKFIESIQPEKDMRDYLMAYCASFLEGSNKDQKFMIWTGCFAKNQGIYLHDGSIKLVQDITSNDFLLGDDLKPRKILKLIRGTGQMYKIKIGPTDEFVVNEDHILTLVYTNTVHNIVENNNVLMYNYHQLINGKLVHDCIYKKYNPSKDNYMQTHEQFKNDILNFYIDKFVEYCTTNIYNIFPKHEDAQIADAILELFRKREHIDIFNKKALYIYIKEIVDVKAPKITRIANQLHKIFKKGYLFYLENGYIKF
jgi:hypothetical protein